MKIIQHSEPVFDEDGEHIGFTPRIGKCDCGQEVYLHGWICPCDCGREYNSSGDLLAPRNQWGWETGEHPSEIAMAESYGWRE